MTYKEYIESQLEKLNKGELVCESICTYKNGCCYENNAVLDSSHNEKYLRFLYEHGGSYEDLETGEEDIIEYKEDEE
nr:MAG TPA: hypothetical protein [Caudoviricetes sp.]